MPLDIELLRSSFKVVAPKSEYLVTRFYDTLFEHYPKVKPLFKNADMDKQRTMLLQALALLVKKIDDTDLLIPYLHELGKRHVIYGIQEEHYDAFGESLITALSETSGTQWTKDIEDTWLDAYSIIKKNMIAGAGY